MSRPSTLDIKGLEALLHTLGADIPVPKFSEIQSFPLQKPIDIYRLYLLQATKQITEIDPAKIYDSFQRTALSRGNLVLVAPRLGLRGKRPEELAADIVAKVRQCFGYVIF
jgi:arginyl-tRNA synthetase